MLTSIKNGVKKLICLVIGLIFSSDLLNAQPIHLQPEMDINSGLQSNSVRVIQKDDQQRLWVGTDHGLVILNDPDSSLQNITDIISDQQVWALAFNKNFVIIGTRFNGLYVFNLSNKHLEKHFDSTSVGLCRRFRVFRDTVFIATNGRSKYLIKVNDNWKLTKINSTNSKGFFTDFTLWQNQVFASLYAHGNEHLYQFQNDSFVQSPLLKKDLFPIDMLSSLALASNDSILALGGDGFNIRINQQKKSTFELLQKKPAFKNIPVWDATFVGTKVYMATGNPDNNHEGMIYEPSVTSLNDLSNTFFGQALYYNKTKKGMWAGTLNKGLFYWPWISESYYIPGGSANEYNFKPINSKMGLLISNEKVYKKSLINNELKELFNKRNHKNSSMPVMDAVYWNDTTAVLSNYNLYLIDSTSKIIKSFVCGEGNYIHKNGDHLYVFSIYVDSVMVINIKTSNYKVQPYTSNQIKAIKYNNNLFYSSTNTGFHYFDSLSHSFNIPFPDIDSYTIQSDTLWVLNAGIVRIFKIDLLNFKLIPIAENNIKEKISGFSPYWILQQNGNIYCGDNKGFLKLNIKTGKPNSYTYIGNYSQGKAAVSNEMFMYFNLKNYIIRLNPDSSIFTIDRSMVKMSVVPEKTIYQYTPFILHFLSADYLIQKHSLKEIEIFKNGRLISTLFTLDDQYRFPAGMGKGRYVLRFKINGIPVGEKNISIKIPLTSNPLFYICITIIIIVFFLLLFKSILDKRTYDKRILENRLQLLKQNLNPHFVFNSLNLIYSLVLQRKNEAAIKTINNFSDLHRYYLENINKSTISLEEELKFIESYLKLEAERQELDNPFIYTLPKDINTEARNILVPPMILQPLVENAVKYCGKEIQGSTSSFIWIDIKMVSKQLIVGIENTTGDLENMRISGSGLGLKLVQERIEIFNKTFKKNLTLNDKNPPIHCKNGYRCELLIS